MADNKKDNNNKITLVLSDDGTRFVPTKLPLSILRSIKEGISKTLNPFEPFDSREKYSVSIDLADNPNVELYTENGKGYAVASVNILQNYNKSWNPGGISGAAAKAQGEGVRASKQEIEEALTSEPGKKTKVTKEELFGTTADTAGSPLDYRIKPTDYLPSTSVNSRGQIVRDENGNASFQYQLPVPNAEQPEYQPATLLPGGMGYFYVKPLIDAAKEFQRAYSYKSQTGGPSIRDLKQELWQNRFMSDEDYKQSLRPGLENRFTPETSTAVENMLNEVSVSNKALLEQGSMEILGWQDFLKQTYQDAIVTATSVSLPSEKAIQETLRTVYKKYKNTEPTEQDFIDFTNEVIAAAKSSPATASEFKDPVTGTTTQMTMGGFTDADIADLAEKRTRGTAERRSYYALQQFGEAFNAAVNGNNAIGRDTLAEVLQ